MDRPKQVRLLRCFNEDGRISLDHYASKISSNNIDSDFSISEFTPTLRSLTSNIFPRMDIRWARYFDYNRQAKSIEADVLHVIDEGYGHLITSLNDGLKVITLTDLMPYLGWKG